MTLLFIFLIFATLNQDPFKQFVEGKYLIRFYVTVSAMRLCPNTSSICRTNIQFLKKIKIKKTHSLGTMLRMDLSPACPGLTMPHTQISNDCQHFFNRLELI